ncbi:hypothetical protein JP09_009950 [Dehalogenimonas etheniformans]|uniref:Uncharacterized protein n=1 Tax=Dehalogenimonas etheniformans TaxID=1536648 RepID=A0A2P5P4Y5_9CHLR|nr:hypothetical protein JP09_009950 [Dehalogenimonas etheniformans]
MVKITKNLGEVRTKEIIGLIGKHITEYKGKTEDRTEGRHGIPMMIFERQQDAHLFANELSKKLDFPKEHVESNPVQTRFDLTGRT